MGKITPLKVISMIIGAAGFFVAAELQRRETKELIEEILDERDADSEI